MAFASPAAMASASAAKSGGGEQLTRSAAPLVGCGSTSCAACSMGRRAAAAGSARGARRPSCGPDGGSQRVGHVHADLVRAAVSMVTRFRLSAPSSAIGVATLQRRPPAADERGPLGAIALADRRVDDDRRPVHGARRRPRPFPRRRPSAPQLGAVSGAPQRSHAPIAALSKHAAPSSRVVVDGRREPRERRVELARAAARGWPS